jgi:hypothetical protein
MSGRQGIAGYVESELLKVSLDDYSEADARIERTKGAISPCRYSKLQLLFSMPELRPHESMSPAGLLGPFDPWPGAIALGPVGGKTLGLIGPAMARLSMSHPL